MSTKKNIKDIQKATLKRIQMDPMGNMKLKTMLEDAKGEGEERGEKIGEMRGERIGIEKGKIEGIKEGEEKRTNLILKALEMLKQGFSKEEIEKETHLSGDVLDRLFSAV